MTEYVWHSPGGLYNVPDDFKARFLHEFPDYRIRWSLREDRWHLEQKCGRGALAPFRIDPADDSYVRARDGYWLVMAIQPGPRMACPGVVQRTPRQHCNTTLSVPIGKSKEVVCSVCKKSGRDGRTITSYWPLDETLLEHLRYTDPLRGGTTKQKLASDKRNAQLLIEADKARQDAITSVDAVDYRWISGIASSTGRTRRTIDTKDLL